jgi:hypothetical protein
LAIVDILQKVAEHPHFILVAVHQHLYRSVYEHRQRQRSCGLH